VAQRANEIGIRMALGANQGDVVRMVVRQAVGLAVMGLTIGLAGSVAGARLLAGFLYEVRPTDTLTYAAVAGFLCMATLATSYLPARRAARIDPLIALRQD
jgi:putative ABC transport system permease protein